MNGKPKQPTTVLDLSKGLGFGLLYRPVIGNIPPDHYPWVARFQLFLSKK